MYKYLNAVTWVRAWGCSLVRHPTSGVVSPLPRGRPVTKKTQPQRKPGHQQYSHKHSSDATTYQRPLRTPIPQLHPHHHHQQSVRILLSQNLLFSQTTPPIPLLLLYSIILALHLSILQTRSWVLYSYFSLPWWQGQPVTILHLRSGLRNGPHNSIDLSFLFLYTVILTIRLNSHRQKGSTSCLHSNPILLSGQVRDITKLLFSFRRES